MGAGHTGVLWAGIDAGKGFHWACVLDASGERLLSRRVENDEADLLALIDEVLGLAGGDVVFWAVDQPGGTAALLLALLWERGQRVLYVPGLVVDRARDAYRGESKTDQKDARVIADQGRVRRDLSELSPGDAALAELQLLVARRRDLVADRGRTVNRLRGALLALFPALERVLSVRAKGDLVLLARYQTPAAVRRAGRGRIGAYLKKRGVKGAAALADRAMTAAGAQRSAELPAQDVAAAIVADLAREALDLKEKIHALEAELSGRFFARPEAPVLASLPGMGAVLGAEFLVAVGDLSAFEGADQLAAYAGLMPASRDSGKRTGNRRRTRGGNKALKQVFYQSAFASLRYPQSRAYYDHKRAEGKKHTQALVALARRRVNVVWAMLRDGTPFEAPSAA